MSDSMLLIDIGQSAGTLPNTTPAPVRYGSWFPVPHQALPVPSVSGLTATPVADGILLQWDALDLPDVVYVIERATSVSGPWTELARTANTHYLVSDPSGDTWHFRVIPLLRGRAGDDAKVEGASKTVADDADIAGLVEKQQAIDHARVLEKVEWIETNAETLVEELLRSHEAHDIRRQHNNTLNRALTDISVLAEDGVITAQQITDLFAQLADEASARQAQYLQVNTAIADETAARVSSHAQLHAQFTAADTADRAALNARIDTAEANAESARAATEATLTAQIVAGDTAVTTAFTTRANQVEANAASALATEKSALAAQIAAGDAATSTALHERADEVEATAAWARATMQNTWAAQLNNAQAMLQSSINTKVTETQAQAIATTQVQAFQNGTFATLQQSFNVVANEHNNMHGKWSASYSVKLTGGTFNGQPVIAGISLSANPNTGSDFIVQSENFYVVTQDASSGLELRDGYLRVFKGNVQRIIGNGFGQGGQLVDYFGPNVGPGSASKSNAIIWMDAAGNAMFKGKINAHNIIGSIQNHTFINWSGMAKTFQNTSGGTGGNGFGPTVVSFTLPAPDAVGESHIPYLDVIVEMAAPTATVSLFLEVWEGDAWQLVTRRALPFVHTAWSGGDNTRPVMEQYIPFSGFHVPVSGARDFRIRATSSYARDYSSNTGLSAYVTKVRGYIVGLR